MTATFSKNDCKLLEQLEYIGLGGGGDGGLDPRKFVRKENDNALNLTLNGNTVIDANSEDGSGDLQVEIPSTFGNVVKFKYQVDIDRADLVTFSYEDSMHAKHQKSAQEIMKKIDDFKDDLAEIHTHTYVEENDFINAMNGFDDRLSDDEDKISENTKNILDNQNSIRLNKTEIEKHEKQLNVVDQVIDDLSKRISNNEANFQTHDAAISQMLNDITEHGTKITKMEDDIDELKKNSGGSGGGGLDPDKFVQKENDTATNLTLIGKTTILNNPEWVEPDPKDPIISLEVSDGAIFNGNVQFKKADQVEFCYDDVTRATKKKSAKEIMETIDQLDPNNFVKQSDYDSKINEINTKITTDETKINENSGKIATHETKIAKMEGDIDDLKNNSGGGGGGLDPDAYVKKTDYDNKMTAIDAKTATYDEKLKDVEIADLKVGEKEPETVRYFNNLPIYANKGFRWGFIKSGATQPTVYYSDHLSTISSLFYNTGRTLPTFTMKYKKIKDGKEEEDPTGLITANTIGQKVDEFQSSITTLQNKTKSLTNEGSTLPTFKIEYHPIKNGVQDTQKYLQLPANQIGQTLSPLSYQFKEITQGGNKEEFLEVDMLTNFPKGFKWVYDAETVTGIKKKVVLNSDLLAQAATTMDFLINTKDHEKASWFQKFKTNINSIPVYNDTQTFALTDETHGDDVDPDMTEEEYSVKTFYETLESGFEKLDGNIEYVYASLGETDDDVFDLQKRVTNLENGGDAGGGGSGGGDDTAQYVTKTVYNAKMTYIDNKFVEDETKINEHGTKITAMEAEIDELKKNSGGGDSGGESGDLAQKVDELETYVNSIKSTFQTINTTMEDKMKKEETLAESLEEVKSDTKTFQTVMDEWKITIDKEFEYFSLADSAIMEILNDVDSAVEALETKLNSYIETTNARLAVLERKCQNIIEPSPT